MIECDDDLVLVEAARQGETEAFGHLVRKYQGRLHATVARLTGTSSDAADILQDAFVRAYQKLDQFHGDSSFYTWMYRIAVNLAMTHKRSQKTMRNRFFTRGATPPPEPISLDDPSLPIERAERERQVQAALNALDPLHRAVVVLKDLDGCRYEEIADALGIPIGTVRSRLHRARHALRDRLAGLDLESPSHPAPRSSWMNSSSHPPSSAAWPDGASP
jgi:RNA polymerase sigma-70 factor (ECF subfamily)